MATYLQAQFRMPTEAKIRVIYDPSGSPAISEFTVNPGDTWDGASALQAAINDQVESDIGGGKAVFSIDVDTEAYTGTSRITGDANGFSVIWSQTGDGTALRDWLGWSADIVGAHGAAVAPSPMGGVWYPPLGARLARRQRSWRHHAYRQSLSGRIETKHNVSPSDVDDALVDVELWCDDGSGDQEGRERFEAFMNAHFDDAGATARFNLFWGEDGEEESLLLRWPEWPIRVAWRPHEMAPPRTLWRYAFTAELQG